MGKLLTKADSSSENEEYHMVVFDSSIGRTQGISLLDEIGLLFLYCRMRQLIDLKSLS
jgi:hypothetical protein